MVCECYHCVTDYIKLENVYEHTRVVKDFVVCDDVLMELSNTGFENLIAFCKTDHRLHRPLLWCLANSYDSEKKVFKLGYKGEVELYFGLSDILCTIGLPISGRPLVVIKGDSVDTIRRIFPDCEGLYYKNKGLSLEGLKNVAVAKNNEGYYTHELQLRVKATVLYLLGTVIFPGSSPNHMNPIWVNFVEDDHEIGDYAWGQAALVEIVDTLVSFRENGCLGGCMSALMAFAFQHIKPLQELFRCENDPNTFPLVVGWGERLCHTLKDTHNPKLDEDIFSCFHELGLEDICANPYNQCFRLMPQHYQKEKRMELAILPIFRVDRGIFNEPYKYSNPQVEITTDRKEEMKNWMKNHYSIAEKNYRQYKNFQCKGLRGKWIKDYWQQWKVKLGMDVSYAQLTDEQPWLPKVMDMDVDETPVDGAAAEMDEDGPAMDDRLIEDQVIPMAASKKLLDFDLNEVPVH